eukprot:TRINITY_DN1074_c0_g1_i1.p1 TRINITY_DN1074_c0_g1~~TRINITY_DN1074_c0_g1_i1.p1  ORF type:complete len:637 (-),score=146.40 TRINITY_DN1074_c0_g1_i1:200-2023(-)
MGEDLRSLVESGHVNDALYKLRDVGGTEEFVKLPASTIQQFWSDAFSTKRWLDRCGALEFMAEILSSVEDEKLVEAALPNADSWKMLDWDSTWKISKPPNLRNNFLIIVSSPRFHLDHSLLPSEGLFADAVRTYVHSLPAADQVMYPRMYISEEALQTLLSPAQILVDKLDLRRMGDAAEQKESREVKILLLGDAGVGKSCLINRMHNFLEGDPRILKEAAGGHSLTDRFIESSVTYETKDKNISAVTVTFVDSPGLTRKPESRENSSSSNDSSSSAPSIESNIERCIDYIVDSVCLLNEDGTPKTPVDMILWCISGAATRISQEDSLLFKTISAELEIPVVVVFTKACAHVETLLPLRKFIEDQEFGNIRGFQVTQARSSKVLGSSEISAYGLTQLAELVAGVYNSCHADLDETIQGIRKNLSDEQLQRRKERVDSIINRAVIGSCACGVLPPIYDDAAAYSICMVMVAAMLRQYRVRTKLSTKVILWHILKSAAGRSVFSAVKFGSWMAANAVGDALKSMPWFWAAGAAVSGSVLAVSTMFAGETLRNYLDSEAARTVGKIVDAEDMKQALEEQAKVTMDRIQELAARTQKLIRSQDMSRVWGER